MTASSGAVRRRVRPAPTANPGVLHRAWSAERRAALVARRRGDVGAERHQLERAHVLGEPLAGLHVRSHLAMFGHALRRRDRREVARQLLRLVVAAPAAWTRPTDGTTGRRTAPVPEDLRVVLDAHHASRVRRSTTRAHPARGRRRQR